MALVAVKDPSVLAQLEGAKPVSDPAILSQLEGGSSVSANLARIDQRAEADKFEEPSTFAYLFNRIKKGAAGFMGLPGDLYQLAAPNAKNLRDMAADPNLPAAQRDFYLQRAGEIEQPAQTVGESFARKPIATSADYRDLVGFDPKMKTGSDLKRYAGGVAEMVGAGGPFALASKPAAMLPILTGSAGSGIGMEAGGDIAAGLGQDRQTGEAIGSLGLGISSAIAPNAGIGLAKVIRNRFSPSANKAAAESSAGREITEQLESYPAAQANIQRSLEVSNEIPGFNPSLPARSNAPGLLAEEKKLISSNPRTLNRAVENVENNEAAIKAFVDGKFPAGTESAADQVRKLGQMHADRLDRIRTELDGKLDDAMRVFESNPTNYENGNRLRDLFFKQKEAYAATKTQKYQDVYREADKLGVRADISDAIDYADSVLKSDFNAYQASEIPPVFRQLAKKKPGGDVPADVAAFVEKQGGKPAGDVSFAELHSLYKRANADIASLRGSSSVDKDFKLHLLGELKTKLTDKIKAFEADGFGEVATKLKEANRFYADEYLPRFKQGFGSDVAARYSSGEFRTPDQMVTELITKRPNNTQAAKDFKLLFDEVPEAQQSLRAGYLDELYRSGGLVDKNGQINQKTLDTFLRRHEPTLAEFPEIKAELKGLAENNAALLEHRAAVVAAEKKLAADDLFKLFQGKDPNVVLAEATANPNAMRVLAFQARNNPNMAKSLARGVAEHVTTQADPAAFLAANEDAIRLALKPMGEDHFKNLQTAVEAMTINSRNPAATSVQAASVAPDGFAQKLGSSPRAIIAHILNIERGRTGPAQEGAAFLGRFFDKMRRDHKAVAMEAVFYSKDAAKAIAELARNPESSKAQFNFATQMTALGVRSEVAGQE